MPLRLAGRMNILTRLDIANACNNKKGKKPLHIWAALHPEVNENLPKHLKFISGIIKREHIKEMYDYPEQAARQAIRLAKGKIHIPTDYDTRD